MKPINDHFEKQKKQGTTWIAIATLLVLLTYFLGFQKTIKLYTEKGRIESETSAYQTWKQRQDNILPTINQSENGEIQMQLFNKISKLSVQEHVTIEEMSAPLSYEQSGVAVNLYRLQLASSFKNLLRMVHALETQFPQGRVVGYRFEILNDASTRKERLVMQLLVQSIGNKKTE